MLRGSKKEQEGVSVKNKFSRYAKKHVRKEVTMVLYLKAESDIPDLMIDFIEVKLKSGQIISLTWDESEFDRKDGYLDARYKGVYFDDEYGNGRLPELKGMEVQHIELFSEYEDASSFKLRELSFHDGEESLAFTYPECQTERSSNGE